MQIPTDPVMRIMIEVIILPQVCGMITRWPVELYHPLERSQASVGAFSVHQVQNLLLVISIDHRRVGSPTASVIRRV